MVDPRAARICAHKQNLDRYCRLLTGHLTDIERQFVHKRIADEGFQLKRLEANCETALAFFATHASRGQSYE